MGEVTMGYIYEGPCVNGPYDGKKYCSGKTAFDVAIYNGWAPALRLSADEGSQEVNLSIKHGTYKWNEDDRSFHWTGP